MTPLQPQRKIFSSANLCKYNFQVWLMRQAGFINHGLLKVSIIITNAMTSKRFFCSVLQMLFFNIDSDCHAQSFLQTDSCSLHTTWQVSHIRKQGEESACLVAFKRISCSPIIILNKQTIRSLSISPPSNFLHLNFPPHLSPSSTSLTHVVVVASPAQALGGPNTPMPHTTCPMQLPHLPQQTDICACLCPSQGHPCQRSSFCVKDGHSVLTCPGCKSLQKLQSTDRVLQEAVFVFSQF